MCSNGAGSSFEMEPELEKIVKELESGADESEPPFYSVKTLQPEDFKVEVIGIGSIADLSDEKLQKLIALSKQAKFGKGEQTVLDTKVRYTQEIDASNLKIMLNQQVFETMLDEMRVELELPHGTKLQAHLYNMLVYTSGQFFKPHQDSEKLDDMVATLVISLPFAHIGGNLIIRHQGSEFSFSTEELSPTQVKCVAFYTDCEHEVKEIRQGFRNKQELAYEVLSKVGMVAINLHNVNAILALQAAYGIDWCLKLVKHWRQEQHKVEIKEILGLIQNTVGKIDDAVLIMQIYKTLALPISFSVEKKGFAP